MYASTEIHCPDIQMTETSIELKQEGTEQSAGLSRKNWDDIWRQSFSDAGMNPTSPLDPETLKDTFREAVYNAVTDFLNTNKADILGIYPKPPSTPESPAALTPENPKPMAST